MAMNIDSLRAFIEKRTGLNQFEISPASGGDIAQSYFIQGNSRSYFLKSMPGQNGIDVLTSERIGLEELENKSSFHIPKIIDFGVLDNFGVLLMEKLEERSPSKKDWQEFGNALAKMHQVQEAKFGFKTSNFIGTLNQSNSENLSWSNFFSRERIYPLCQILARQHAEFAAINLPSLEKAFKGVFPNEPPALLHGDLWGGNVMFTTKGFSLYDPSVYYGHREIDIAMTQLFGGFDRHFLYTYNECYPLENGWEERIQLGQLYPILVHAVLFGGHYTQSALSTINRYL